MKTLILRGAFSFFYQIFNFFSINFKLAHRIYVKLYCLTGSKIDKNYIKTPINSKNKEVQELIDNGYIKLDFKIKDKILDSLNQFSEKTKVIDDKGNNAFFDQKNIKSVIYRYNENDIINNEFVQEILADQKILKLIKEYFGKDPFFDLADMWWSTSFNQNPSKEAAQWFHFDLDRMNWLKVFVYITDVKMTNGPHCYVEGSHKIGGKPQSLLDRGYERISDSDIRKYYKNSKIKYLTGLKGEIFIGNTKAWHKGVNLREGNRLILQLQFTDSFFLLNPNKYKIKIKSKNLKGYLNKNPNFFKGRKIV